MASVCIDLSTCAASREDICGDIGREVRTRACCTNGVSETRREEKEKHRGTGRGYSRQVMTHCFLQKALTMLSIIAK